NKSRPTSRCDAAYQVLIHHFFLFTAWSAWNGISGVLSPPPFRDQGFLDPVLAT
ncbi:hypothetical protein DFH06DRAFT_1057941, partial [Mycena polygramma]